MDEVLSWAKAKESEQITLICELVECESPSDDPTAIHRFVELLADRISPVAEVETYPFDRYGPNARFHFAQSGGNEKGQVLALGHSDTVYPMGTLREMPCRREQGRLWGPGVLDMKGGIVIFVFAMRAIRELGLPLTRAVVLQLNADEEIGSPSSRELTEEAARKSAAVLVLEPGTGLQGKAKTSRKGVGDYLVTVRGKASHAGVDFAAGASAIVELAHQIDAIARFTDLECGITVNPGVVSGGTRTNVIAGTAHVEVDIRIERLEDAAELDRQFRSLKPWDARCTIEVEGGLNRPPMERTPGVVSLFQKAKQLASDVGIELEESSTGGGSDGNFTASLAPTLDGIGAVGEGAHSPGESILIDRLADRTALLAKLIAAI